MSAGSARGLRPDIQDIFAKLGLPETATHNKRVHAALAYLRTG